MTREFCGRHGQPLRTARRAAWPRGLVTVPGLALEPPPGVSVQRPLRRPGGPRRRRGSAGGGDGRDGRTTGGDRKGLGGGGSWSIRAPGTRKHRDTVTPRNRAATAGHQQRAGVAMFGRSTQELISGEPHQESAGLRRPAPPLCAIFSVGRHNAVSSRSVRAMASGHGAPALALLRLPLAPPCARTLYLSDTDSGRVFT